MSKRWFILAFSILFLFAFRVWINDLSSVNHDPLGENAINIPFTENHPLLIFPASMDNNTFIPDEFNFLRIENGNAEVQETVFFSGFGSRYIFPVWPDTLVFSFQDVLVDNRGFMYSYINRELNLQEN